MEKGNGFTIEEQGNGFTIEEQCFSIKTDLVTKNTLEKGFI